MASTVPLSIPLFRQLFAEFANATLYPDKVLQLRWDNEATAYVSDANCGSLTDSRRAYAVLLMLAHLMRLNKLLVAPGTPLTGVVVGAQVDKVNVTLQPPPAGTPWTFWLNQTPYGQMLAAYLSAKAAGGFYVGGLPEGAAFRKVGGVF